MKAILQRVSEASVSVDQRVTGEIGVGLLVLLCAEPDDTEETSERLIKKILALRIFPDEANKMNLSLSQIQGALLVVSQFTLAADTRRGNRPSFTGAASPEHAKYLYEDFIVRARRSGLTVASGVFGANMQVSLVNDGPVTIPINVSSP